MGTSPPLITWKDIPEVSSSRKRLVKLARLGSGRLGQRENQTTKGAFILQGPGRRFAYSYWFMFQMSVCHFHMPS
jgi:hypothetical protein